jgi:peptidyl-prolyl cis-trans isomerase D
MATLEKIRSKSVLLVSIIFVALFLFIITIIDNPLGLFQDTTTVAKVNGEKIDYEKYQNRATELREQNPQLEDADENALQALISETLFNQAYSKLGIVVTPEEISRAIVGYTDAQGNKVDAPYQIAAAFQQQYGVSPEEFLAYVNNPAAYNIPDEQVAQLSSQYQAFENQVEQYMLSQKLFSLLSGTVVANKLDSKQLFDEGNTNYTLATVSKSIFTVNDTVTEADIKKYYEEHKAAQKISEPVRYVKYVNLAISPSATDRNAALAQAEEALAAINAQPSMEGVSGNSLFVVEYATADTTKLKQLRQPGLVNFIKTGAVDSAKIVINSAYAASNPQIVIAKLLGRESKVNGAKIRQVTIDPAFNADSVIAKLNAGIPADSIEGVQGKAQEVPVNYSQINKQIADTLNAIGLNRYISLGGQNGIVAVCVSSFNAPEPIYDYATATYTVEPSKATIDGLQSRVREFLVSASTAATFDNDHAVAQGLTVEDALVGPSSSSLANLTDSRGMVAWAMDAKKGEVSRLFTDSRNTRFSAVAVVDIYKGDYLPLSFPPAHDALSTLALNEKRADVLMKQFEGKGPKLADFAKAMGANTVDTLRNVTLAGIRYSQLGGLRAHKVGDVVGPVRWNSSVIAYQVLEATPGTMPYDEKSNSMQYQRQAQQILFNDVTSLLLGKGKIDNRILKFTRQ